MFISDFYFHPYIEDIEADWYDPFNFSNISGFLHKNPDIDARSIPSFCVCDDSVILHMSSFIEFILSVGIAHEHDMMNFFS